MILKKGVRWTLSPSISTFAENLNSGFLGIIVENTCTWFAVQGEFWAGGNTVEGGAGCHLNPIPRYWFGSSSGLRSLSSL